MLIWRRVDILDDVAREGLSSVAPIRDGSQQGDSSASRCGKLCGLGHSAMGRAAATWAFRPRTQDLPSREALTAYPPSGPAAQQNPPQVGIGDGRRREGNDDPLAALLGGGGFRRDGLLQEFPPLPGGFEDLLNGGPENGPINRDGVPHVVPGPIVRVHPAGGIEDEEIRQNAPLLREEQEDVQALQVALEVFIPMNTIKARHFWRALRKLRALMPKLGPYQIPYLQVEYARILRRLAMVMAIPTRVQYEGARRILSLDYDAMLLLMHETTPECPSDFGEGLDRICEHLTAAESLLPESLETETVHIFRDVEEFGHLLRSLATRLLPAE